jgi:hypothetical protein
MVRRKVMIPKYPDVKVQLVGEDGNAFAIVGRVARALREAGVPPKEVAAYMKEAMASDYDKTVALRHGTLSWRRQPRAW